jgi:lysozyme family protein
MDMPVRLYSVPCQLFPFSDWAGKAQKSFILEEQYLYDNQKGYGNNKESKDHPITGDFIFFHG